MTRIYQGILLLAAVAILAWQVMTLRPQDGRDALAKFKANHWVGLAFSLALLGEALRQWLAMAH